MYCRLPLLDKPSNLKYLLTIFIGSLLLYSCARTDLFEKNVSFPNHKWDNAFKPTITFNIEDTLSAYNIFLVVRHMDAYHFNNLWVKIKSKAPGDSISATQQFDLPLASQKEWMGVGMDDIFEHRILLYQRPVKFQKQGTYTVILEQVMRENPLEEIMNVGLRLEKVREP
jgi:gliding motility-associated lipoprotein GldH